MHEIARKVLIPLPMVLGIDLSITNEVLLLWTAAAVTFCLVSLGCRRSGLVARGYLQNLFESLMEFIDREVVEQGIGAAGKRWSPLLLTIFFFVLVANLLGMVPLPSHFKAVTSDLTVTVALSLVVFSVTIWVNVRQHGLLGFLRKFVPSGIPLVISVLAIPIEVISWMAKPVSLAVRLFANMMVGHALILVFIALAMEAAWFLSFLPFAGAVIMSGFELFVCLIQAFIFTMLSGIYIREALDSGH
jgi:F-type H+-transporting ATPase subunit a